MNPQITRILKLGVSRAITPVIRTSITLLSREPSVSFQSEEDGPIELKSPFGCSLEFKTYPSPAFALGILEGSNHGRAASCAGYFGLYFPTDKLCRDSLRSPSILDHLNVHDLIQLGYLGCENLDHLAETRNFRSIVHELVSAINQRNYVLTNINEFYIPNTARYRKMDFRHPMLIYGWRKTTESFLCAGYFGNHFGSNWIPAAMLVRGIISRGKLDFITERYHGSQPLLRVLHLCKSHQVNLSTIAIRKQLTNYLASLPPPIECLSVLKQIHASSSTVVALPRPYNCVYGLSTYDHYAQYLRSALARRLPLDLRATRVLAEHKMLMLRRLEYLISGGNIRRTNSAESWKEVTRWASSLHYSFVQWQGDNAFKAQASELLDRIPEQKAKEEQVLRSVDFELSVSGGTFVRGK